MKPPITDELVERCAQAAHAVDLVAPWPWEKASDHARELYRGIARAVLEEALRPAPPPPVPDGQHPLI